jgi:hypothetical protein
MPGNEKWIHNFKMHNDRQEKWINLDQKTPELW